MLLPLLKFKNVMQQILCLFYHLTQNESFTLLVVKSFKYLSDYQYFLHCFMQLTLWFENLGSILTVIFK